MASKLALAICLSFLVVCGSAQGIRRRYGESSRWRLRDRAEQCRLDRIQATQPNRRIVSEAGVTEVWEDDADFLCSGLFTLRHILQPNSLGLPNYNPAPALVYVEQGEGFVGVNYPGCPETFDSERSGQSSRRSYMESSRWWDPRRGSDRRSSDQDQHQKVHRIRRGDIVAIPSGAVAWSHNDGNEELVLVAVYDLNNMANQLDSNNFRAFLLAGGQASDVQRGQRRSERREYRSDEGRSFEEVQNVFRGFDLELLSEALNVPNEIASKLQHATSRGVIVSCREQMRFLTPEEDEGDEYYGQSRRWDEGDDYYGQSRRWRRNGLEEEGNGLEETVCTTRIRHNMNTRRESDIYQRHAGRVHIVNDFKLPILRLLNMGAEKGNLFPNALYSPHWSMSDHRVLYVLRGEAHVQISDNNGRTVLDETVREGQRFLIPQFYAILARAGNQGFEWISFRTNSQTMNNPLVGYTSVLRAMPQEVLENAYRMSPRQVQQIEQNRDRQTFLLPPSRFST